MSYTTSEIDKLLAWMKTNQHNTDSLATAVGMSYDGVYQILYVRKRTSPGFRERFTHRFGQEVADQIFEPLPITQGA